MSTTEAIMAAAAPCLTRTTDLLTGSVYWSTISLIQLLVCELAVARWGSMLWISRNCLRMLVKHCSMENLGRALEELAIGSMLSSCKLGSLLV